MARLRFNDFTEPNHVSPDCRHDVTHERTNMNKNLKRTVLDNRQFGGLLLLTCSIATFVIVLLVTAHASDGSLQTITAQYQAQASAVEKFGFLLPPLNSFIAPMLATTAFLAGAYLWLSIRTNQSRDSAPV